MVPHTLASGETESKMDLALNPLQMGRLMLVIGRVIKPTVRVVLQRLMGRSLKAFGLMANLFAQSPLLKYQSHQYLQYSGPIAI